MARCTYSDFKPVFFAVSLAFLFFISGCAQNTLSISSKARQEVEKSADDDRLIWKAPELQSRKFRALFYGYDTLYYRLVAFTSGGQSSHFSYRLIIDSHYGRVLRHYERARAGNGQEFPISLLNHSIERCQLFGNLVSACLYRDTADVILDRTVLEKNRKTGLILALSSKTANYETIKLAPAYIDRFLHAVSQQK